MNANNYYEKRPMLLLENSLKELQAMKPHVHVISYKYHRSQCLRVFYKMPHQQLMLGPEITNETSTYNSLAKIIT